MTDPHPRPPSSSTRSTLSTNAASWSQTAPSSMSSRSTARFSPGGQLPATQPPATMKGPRSVQTAVAPTLTERLSRLENARPDPSQQDLEEASRLAVEHRSKTRPGGGWSSTTTITYKDSSAVLEQIALGLVPSATPALVVALIQGLEGSVCVARRRSTNLLKRMRGVDQDEVRSRALENAARHCPDEIFHAMARFADDEAMQQALAVALGTTGGQPLKTMVLLSAGADASRYCDEFLATVESGPDDLVRTLLAQGPRGACQSCRDRGLVIAARLGRQAVGHMLLDAGADATAEHGAALFGALRRDMERFAMHIAQAAAATGPEPGWGRSEVGPPILDAVVGEAYDRGQHQLVVACVRAGARGEATDAVLIKAVRERQSSLVDVLVQHGASVAYQGGRSLRQAVQSGRAPLLASLLRAQPLNLVPGIVGAALMETTQLGDAQTALEMMTALAAVNVHGDSVTEVLVQVLRPQAALGDDHVRVAFARLLCGKSGSVDVDAYGGECLASAARNGWIETFRVVVACRPSTRSLQGAMEPIMNMPDAQLRLRFLDAILGQTDPEPGLPGRERVLGGGDDLVHSAFVAAARHLLLDVMKYLATKVTGTPLVPDAVLADAWTAATAPGREGDWTRPQGVEVLHYLLERGVSGPAVEDAFCRAAPTCSQEAFDLLLHCVRDPATFSRALRHLSEASSTLWTLEDNLWLVDALLNGNPDAHAINLALVAAVKACAARDSTADGGSEVVVEVLLTHGGSGGGGCADINFQQGAALRAAVRGGSVPLLEMLLSSGQAARDTLTLVFQNAITSPIGEDALVRIVDVLFECRGPGGKTVGVDVDALVLPADGRTRPSLPPVAACLETNPGYSKLLRRLIELGCRHDTPIRSTPYGDEGFGEETVTILLWACLSPSITTAVMDVLVAQKADVNFQTSESQTTPLIVASRSGRADVAARLLAAGAGVNVQDRLGLTALRWASRGGDRATVKVLLAAKPMRNDGSLHEAARNKHVRVVRELLRANHDVHFPCMKGGLQGRTVLQELCQAGDGGAHPDGLDEVLQALQAAPNFSVFEAHRGRNAFFLALENDRDPLAMTTRLIAVMFHALNDEGNIFTTEPSPAGTVTCFSATRFLDSPCYRYRDDRRLVEALRALLRSVGCVDRQYEVFGSGDLERLQRPGAVGLPDHVQAVEKRRRDKHEKRLADRIDHEARQRRQEEEAALAHSIKERSHVQQQGQLAATHETKMRQETDRTHQKLDTSHRVHLQQQHQSDAVHRNAIARQREAANQQVDIMRRKQLATTHGQRPNQGANTRLAIER